jgi:hypothetical protein
VGEGCVPVLRRDLGCCAVLPLLLLLALVPWPPLLSLLSTCGELVGLELWPCCASSLTSPD